MEDAIKVEAAAIQEGFANLKDDEVLCDVELEAEGKKVKTHKALLAAVSPYFR